MAHHVGPRFIFDFTMQAVTLAGGGVAGFFCTLAIVTVVKQLQPFGNPNDMCSRPLHYRTLEALTVISCSAAVAYSISLLIFCKLPEAELNSIAPIFRWSATIVSTVLGSYYGALAVTDKLGE